MTDRAGNGPALTKARLIETIWTGQLAETRAQAEEFLATTIETVKRTLALGENVKISGFGSFVVAEKNARIGRNPKTGEALVIRGRRVVKFKASPVLKAGMNDE